jgi:hypothetical protein
MKEVADFIDMTTLNLIRVSSLVTCSLRLPTRVPAMLYM